MIHFIGLLIIIFWGQSVTVGLSSPGLMAVPRNTTVVTRIAYCVITNCKTISCSSISTLDPGEIASKFISSVKAQCPLATSISLVFSECMFPEKTLKRSWLRSELTVDEIRFENCQLSDIEPGAFSTFTSTRSLTLINSQIHSLKSHVFEELMNLRNLIIRDNLIVQVEHDLLGELAESLQTIELDRSLANYQALLNITTGRPLPNVQLVSLQGNHISNVSADVLKGFPNIVSLYLDSSRVAHIHRNAFQFTRTLQQIFITNNLISTLPRGLFDTVLLYNPDFTCVATGNPWNCDCDMSWIQEMLKNYPRVMPTVPKCQKPPRNADIPFTEATFCSETPGTHIEDTTESYYHEPQNNETLDNDTLCTDFDDKNIGKLLCTSDYEFSLKSPDFHFQELNNGTVLINSNHSNPGVSVLWFTVTNLNNVERINCLKNVKTPVQLTNLQENTLYTVCVFEESQFKPSPFNCLALKTQPERNGRTWLSNGDKAIVLSIYSLTLILFCLMGGGICFVIVRKNPSFLKGSRRVVMVHHSQVNAMILPKGSNYPVNKRLQNVAGYLTPIERRKTTTTNPYSSIRSKVGCMFQLQIDKKRESIFDNSPPPLPPRPQLYGAVPRLASVSLSVDSEHKITREPYENRDVAIYS